TPQYLGDLEDNSPLPFSIPLAISTSDDNSNSSGLGAGNYPVSLRITYSDELRNAHEVILDGTVQYSPPQQEEDAPNQGFLGFSSSNAESGTTNTVLPLLFILAAVVAAAVAIIIIKRRRSRSKKISKLMAEQGDDDDDLEPFSSDEYRGSSREDQSSHKR
nr:hypothetical protein [Thermoproteota archaeon]